MLFNSWCISIVWISLSIFFLMHTSMADSLSCFLPLGREGRPYVLKKKQPFFPQHYIFSCTDLEVKMM